jgi:hypothetical protein
MARSKQESTERQVIRDAMDRLLDGSPLYSTGKLTVKSLADEAQVKRWLLTHRHTDLQDEFRAKVAQRGRVPQAVQALRSENSNLEERMTKLASDFRQERETVKRLERVIHVLTLQLEQARQADPPHAQVRPLRRGK